ncbi:MAG: hypothetical protein IKP74_04265 [Clostridia bacterium]|nr:hypothetical protein [Clostridia bacterium]
MKKLTMALALILCLVLCVFAFASCGKKKNTTTDTTAEQGTTPSGGEATTAVQPTTPASTTEKEPEETLPGCAHVPEDEWYIEPAATCIAPGSKVKLCAICGQEIEETREVIPIDPDAHLVTDWEIDAPTLLDPVGSKKGTCLLCEAELDITLNWELEVYDSMDPAGPYKDNDSYTFRKTIGDIRGDKSFAPTEDDPDGNDLWFEYSFLWNDSLYYRDRPENLAEIRMFGFRDTTNWSMYRGFYYLYLRDNGDGFKTSTDCPFRGHIDYSTYDTTASPGENCAYDLSALGNTLNGKLIGRYKAGWSGGRDDAPYLWDSKYQTMGGWHRLGFRYHQEAEIKEGAVAYTGYTELYIDGVLCWKIDSNLHPTHKDSLITKGVLPWSATIDPNDPTKLVYTNNDHITVEMRIDTITSSSQSVFICVDDINWTCGDGFATDVVRVENPKPTKITLPDGKEYDGAMYFAAPDCEHEAEAEAVVVKEATLFEDGVKATYCAKCGEQMSTEPVAYVPKVYNPADLSNYEGDKSMLLLSKTLPQVLGEGNHFYPTETTPDGKALYFDVAILYNETMANSATDEFNFCLNVKGKGGNSFFLLTTKDNSTCWCKYAGGFDYSTASEKTFGPEGGNGAAKENYPNLGEYGWHNVGVKVYQTASIVDGAVAYAGEATLYIDGVKVWAISLNMSKLTTNSNMLFTATVQDGVLVYADPSENVRFQLRGDGINNSTAPMFFIYGEETWSVVDANFEPNIKPVADPAAATYKINDDLTIPAAVYFQPK